MYFGLEVNTISQMDTYNIHADALSTLRDDGTPRALHFELTDEQSGLLRIYAPHNKDEEDLETIDCNSVKINVSLLSVLLTLL